MSENKKKEMKDYITVEFNNWEEREEGNIKGSGKFTIVPLGEMKISFSIKKNKKDGALFLSLPSEKFTGKDGKEKWAHKVFIQDKEYLKELNKYVLSEFYKFKGNGKEVKEINDDFPF